MVFEVSLIPSLRRHGDKDQRRETLRTASTYYMPEGRFYAAPVILKQKKRNRHVLPVFLGLGLSAVSVSSLQKPETAELVAENTTVFARSTVQDNSVMPEGVDPMTTASTTLSQRYQALPLTAENAGGKLGITDPNPDENRVNRDEKTAGLNTHESNALPDLAKPKMQRVSVQMAPQSKGGKHLASLTAPRIGKAPMKVAMSIVPPQKKITAKLPVPKVLASLVTNEQADVLALGYAPTAAKVDTSPFDSVMSDTRVEGQGTGRFIPPIGEKDHAWAATPLPAAAFSTGEQKCLAEAVYFEARGESVKGQAAVAQVVLNRVRNPAYPKSICGVVYQNTNWRNRCQFSFACDGKKHQISEMPQWTVAQQVAKAVSAGQIWLPEVGSATHYHATYVRPRWARSMVKVDKIGLHIFYRTKGGGWS